MVQILVPHSPPLSEHGASPPLANSCHRSPRCSTPDRTLQAPEPARRHRHLGWLRVHRQVDPSLLGLFTAIPGGALNLCERRDPCCIGEDMRAVSYTHLRAHETV